MIFSTVSGCGHECLVLNATDIAEHATLLGLREKLDPEFTNPEKIGAPWIPVNRIGTLVIDLRPLLKVAAEANKKTSKKTRRTAKKRTAKPKS